MMGYTIMGKKIGRTVDVEMDERGRVIIPKNVRNRFNIDPDSGETTWLTVTIEDAEFNPDRGDGSE